MEIELRKAQEKDLEEIAEIYKAEFSKPPYNEGWTSAKAIYKIRLFSRYCEIWKVVCDKEIIGFFVVNTNQFFPGTIAFGEEFAVKGEFQNKGIGTFAIKEIFKIYKKRKFKWFMGIALTRAKALNLYKKLGLSVEKEEVIISKKL